MHHNIWNAVETEHNTIKIFHVDENLMNSGENVAINQRSFLS